MNCGIDILEKVLGRMESESDGKLKELLTTGKKNGVDRDGKSVIIIVQKQKPEVEDEAGEYENEDDDKPLTKRLKQLGM